MTVDEMCSTLHALTLDYEPNLRYLEPDSLPLMMGDIAEVYRWFLRGRPLARIIHKLNIRSDIAEAREQALNLRQPQDFIIEGQDILDTLCFGCGVIRLTEAAWERQAKERQAAIEQEQRILFSKTGRVMYEEQHKTHVSWNELPLDQQRTWYKLAELVRLGCSLKKKRERNKT